MKILNFSQKWIRFSVSTRYIRNYFTFSTRNKLSKKSFSTKNKNQGTGQSNLSAGSWRAPPPSGVRAKGVYAVHEGKPSSSSSNSRPSSGLHSNRSRPGIAEHPLVAAGLAAAPTGTAPTGGKGGVGDPP